MVDLAKKRVSDARYRKKHPDRVRAARKRWLEANKERVRIRHNEYQKEYRTRPGVREKIREANRSWKERNKEKQSSYVRTYMEKNPEKARVYAANSYQRNKHKSRIRAREYQKKQFKENIQFKLGLTIRNRLNRALARLKVKKTSSTHELLGCSFEELRVHLESQFQDGMTWENHSIGGWHIDHILPLSLFDLTRDEELRIVCHYTNLQPMWARENMQKKATLVLPKKLN